MSLDISKLFNGRDLEEENFSNLKKSGKKVKNSKKEEDDRYISQSQEILDPSKHSLHFRIEKRRGKTVTLVGYFQLEDSEKESLLKSLKKELSTGGTLRGDYLEFQGDIKERVKVSLEKRGFRFKR